MLAPWFAFTYTGGSVNLVCYVFTGIIALNKSEDILKTSNTLKEKKELLKNELEMVQKKIPEF